MPDRYEKTETNTYEMFLYKPDRFDRKTIPCVWWDQKAKVYHSHLKHDETVNTDRCQQQKKN